MKTFLLSRFTAALACASFLVPAFVSSAKNPAPEAVELRLELDRPLLPSGGTERAVIRVSLDGIRLPRPQTRPPVNLALVIDRSGSMGGDKIEKAKAAAIEAVRRLSPDDVFSLVAYNNEVETLVPSRCVGNGAGLEAAIQSILAGGGTALYGEVTQGAAELRKYTEDRRYVHRLILLSDGLANVGPSSPQDLARLGSSLIQEGISVTTIGVGLDFNEDLMTQLAQKSDGNTYFVASSRDLVGIFNAELGDVLNIVARSVVLTLEFPEGVRPLAFVGREGTIRGQGAEFTLNQLYGGQEKFALIEVEIASAAAGTEREVARARLTFEDAVAGRAVTVKAAGAVRYTASEKEAVKAANRSVQVDYARNVTAMIKDDVVVLVDAQRKEEAARQFLARNRELEKMATTYGNAEVKSVVSANVAEAERIARDGLDNAARKTYRAENAQVKSQQAVGSASSK